MKWFTVIKTVKGHQYIYRQRTYRVPGKKHPVSESQYVGPVDGGGKKPVVTVITTADDKLAKRGRKTKLLRTIGEDVFIGRLLSFNSYGFFTDSYDWKTEAKIDPPKSDAEVWDLGLRMGVAMTTQMWPMESEENYPTYFVKEHRIIVPDPGRYTSIDGAVASAARNASLDLLHELVHSGPVTS